MPRQLVCGELLVMRAICEWQTGMGGLKMLNYNDDNKGDNINHPSHYTDGKIEVIDFIEDKKLNYHRGNAVKYIARAGKKNAETVVEDLQKARWYIDREIERLGDK